MAERRTSANLLYLDASDIEDDRVDFDGLDVLDTAGQKLGDVEGFIVQRDTRQPYYVVVDSGGWFSSRSFLLPIGHARLDPGNEAMRADLNRDTINRFPEFDEDRFPEMTEEEARQFNERTLSACCATELQQRTGPDRYAFDKWSHYAQPDWWRAEWVGSAPRSTVGTAPVRGTTTYDTPSAFAEKERTERVTAFERDRVDEDIDVERKGERSIGEEPLERAQPGDVLGIERGGETTELGDTARDERERLEAEEEDAAKLRRKDRDRR